MRPVTLFWFLAAALAAQTGSVDGIVVNHTNGQPLSGAHLTLITGDMFGGGIDRAYGAISDRAGHFSIADLLPGTYAIMLQCPGFIQTRTAGQAPASFLSVKAGQHIADYRLEMTPRAVIAGRVVDEYGDPVQGISVQLDAAAPGSQSVAMVGAFGSAATDDRGEFRLVASPGRYYLQTQPRNFSMSGGGEIRTDGTSAGPYAATYYPNTASKSQASVVEAGPGQDVTGIEIRLTRGGAGAAHTLTIGGTVTGAPEGERATIFLRFGESADSLHSGALTFVGPDGKFSFPGLEPKFYRVVAQHSSGKVHLQSQAVDLHLTSSDAVGIQLSLAPGDDLVGSLEISGDAPASAPVPKLSVHLEPADGFRFDGSDSTAAPGKDGSFRVADLFPARYLVRVEQMPETAYIKSIALDGAAVENGVVDLSHGVKGARLKIAVGLNGGQLSGKVLDHEGEPLVSPMARLLVWKDSKQFESDTPRISQGRYDLKGLRPGKYRILAVDAADWFESAAGITDPKEFETTMKAAAEEIEIKEGEHIVKDLKVVDKEKLGGPAKQ
jgi:hypothetical protein